MLLRHRFHTLVVALIIGAGCSTGPGPTSGFDILAIGRVTARTETSSGSPLDSVYIFLKPVQNPGGYGTLRETTAVSGEIQVTLERRVPPSAPIVPDTVRVEVAAQVFKRAYLNAQGVGMVHRDTVLLTLVPLGQTPTAPTITFRFSAP